jgi:hypothetical protein
MPSVADIHYPLWHILLTNITAVDYFRYRHMRGCRGEWSTRTGSKFSPRRCYSSRNNELVCVAIDVTSKTTHTRHKTDMHTYVGTRRAPFVYERTCAHFQIPTSLPSSEWWVRFDELIFQYHFSRFLTCKNVPAISAKMRQQWRKL